MNYLVKDFNVTLTSDDVQFYFLKKEALKKYLLSNILKTIQEHQ